MGSAAPNRRPVRLPPPPYEIEGLSILRRRVAQKLGWHPLGVQHHFFGFGKIGFGDLPNLLVLKFVMKSIEKVEF
jgi:hypothetical protein